MAVDQPPRHDSSQDPAEARPTLLERMGRRAAERARPRLGVGVAAGGAVLTVFGLLMVSVDELEPAVTGGDGNSAVGTILTLLLMVTGYTALIVARRGPVAAAGATAAAVALPFFLVFATFDSGDLPPFSVDAVLLVSTAVWAAAYVLGPSTGRPFFLGASLVGAWLFVLEQVEGLFSAPFTLFGMLAPFGGSFAGGFGEPVPFGFGSAPDPGTIGAISLGFGVAYLVLASMFDQRGLVGVGTPFVVAGLAALVVGFTALGEELEPAAVGLLLVVTGLGVTYFGATSARRLATWLGAGGATLGVALVVGDVFERSSVAGLGLAFTVAGLVVVVLAEALARMVEEPDELDDAPYPRLALSASSSGPAAGPPPAAPGASPEAPAQP